MSIFLNSNFNRNNEERPVSPIISSTKDPTYTLSTKLSGILKQRHEFEPKCHVQNNVKLN